MLLAMRSEDSPQPPDRTGYDSMPPVEGYQFVTGITPGPGGVLTDEAGWVTGDQTLRTEVAIDGQAALYIRHVEGEHWYAVTGAHYRLDDPAQAEALHRAAVELLTRGGADASSLTLT
jgi:hypothetical protein